MNEFIEQISLHMLSINMIIIKFMFILLYSNN